MNESKTDIQIQQYKVRQNDIQTGKQKHKETDKQKDKQTD